MSLKKFLTRVKELLFKNYPNFFAFLFDEFPRYKISSRRRLSKDYTNLYIPPNIYQTWIVDVLGESHNIEHQKFKNINPNLNFIFYDQKKCDSYMRKNWKNHKIYSIYKSAKYGPMKADIFRYCIIYDKGGFYSDINKALSKPVSSFLSDDTRGVISFEKNLALILPSLTIGKVLDSPENLIIQWFFGFEKGHKFLELLINNIVHYGPMFEGKKYSKPKEAILSLTGPGMFTKTFREYLFKYGKSGITQVGIDFNNSSVYSMKGDWSRYLFSPAYEYSKNDGIFYSLNVK